MPDNKTAKKLKSVKADHKRLKGEVRRLRTKLKSSEERAQKWKTRAQEARAAAAKAEKRADMRVAAASAEPVVVPTVAQLRALARDKGISGYSRMTKAQLVAALG